jgi:hypothetical protein
VDEARGCRTQVLDERHPPRLPALLRALRMSRPNSRPRRIDRLPTERAHQFGHPLIMGRCEPRSNRGAGRSARLDARPGSRCTQSVRGSRAARLTSAVLAAGNSVEGVSGASGDRVVWRPSRRRASAARRGSGSSSRSVSASNRLSEPPDTIRASPIVTAYPRDPGVRVTVARKRARSSRSIARQRMQ